QAAVAEDGRIVIVYGVGGAIRGTASADGGRSFAPATTVGTVPALALGMRRGPRVAATGGAVVVTAIGGQQGKGRDGDVLAWRSTDAGRSWAGPVRVNTVEGSAREGLHGMAAGPDGAVYCAWLDQRGAGTEIYGALARDGGATWEPDRLVYRSPNRPKPSVCECCHPSVAFAPDGTLLVMWRNQLAGARDLYLARSADGGRTFGPAEKLGAGTWPLEACPMDGGAIAAGPGAKVETAWMRENRVFAAAPGAAERLLGPGVQPWIARGPRGPVAVWLDRRPGRLMARMPDGRDPVILAEAANDPVVAAAPGGSGPVVAVWESQAGPAAIQAVVLTPAR
ncbi:MAG TPA: sialidase family protein, partial [Isosphaeraceae bacterium]